MKCNECPEAQRAATLPASLTIAIAGNPNCGKSALFNLFTGIRQKTGNWPGVTVDRKEGRCELDGIQTAVIDLPGIYSLDAASPDEEVTRDYLLSREAQLIVNVLDASNLERNLYLSVQLLEMGVPLVIALNMMDIARKRGIQLDMQRLSETLGCPVVPVVAVSKEGFSELQARILGVIQGKESGGFPLAHEEAITQAISELEIDLNQVEDADNRRWLALKLLEGDPHAQNYVSEQSYQKAIRLNHSIAERTGSETDIHIANSRFSHAHALASQCIRHQGQPGATLTDRIDRLVLGRWLGIPFFLLAMYLMFLFSINIGGAFIDFFDGVAGAFLVDGVAYWLESLNAPQWLVLVLAHGVGAGLQVVATFIPIIAALYLFLSVLEDSGYMARAAFVMDRAMRAIGLPGKAFVPLIVGFGCNVPAVMATRTLEDARERKLTILMNPFMSCGARLPVYALFVAAFFPSNGQNLVFLLYLTGIGVAILTGLIMKRTLLPGESTGFMMELPPYHLPTLKGVLLRSWDRVRLFLKEAGQVIVVMVLIINLLNSIGADGSFGNQDSDNSVLSVASQTITPIFAPMGIHEDNWPAVVGIFSGVLAKEVVVGTLDSLYTRLAAQDNGASEEQTHFELGSALAAAAATIPANLSEIGAAFKDPLGLDIGDVSSTQSAASEQAVSEDVFGAMARRFDGQAGAFAYLLFILLYFPCIATIGAIIRETSATWAVFVAGWTTGVAYFTATLFYQLATYAEHPLRSLVWVIFLSLIFATVIITLRQYALRENRSNHVASNP